MKNAVGVNKMCIKCRVVIFVCIIAFVYVTVFQLTDFENAAVVCFVVLLTRVVLSYKLCFLMPMSKVDENMVKAQGRNAVLDQKFWFRNNTHNKEDKGYSLMTVNEIINGKEVSWFVF